MTSPNLGSAHGTITIQTRQALASLVKLRTNSASTIGTLNQMGRAAILGGGAVAGMGAAVAYGFYRAAKTAADFEFKMSFLQATLKASDDQMVALKKSALDFGTTSGFGPREVADSFVALGKAGVSAQEIIGGVGKAVITLGQSADIGLSQAADIIVAVQSTFQLLANEAQHTADVVQGAANASLIDVADFGTTIKYVGNVAAVQGIKLDDLATAIAEIGNQGIRGSTAGTSLRRMLLQLTPRTDKAKQAMQELGIITKNGTNLFYDQTGSAKSLRDIFGILHDKTVNLTDAKKKDALATIFGDRAIATALATAKGGVALYDQFQKQIEESTAAEIAAKRFDNLQGSIRKFKGALEAAFITEGEHGQDPLQHVVESATALVKIFTQMDPKNQKLITQVLLVGAGAMIAVGSLTILFGTVLRGVAIFKQLHGVSTIVTKAMLGMGGASTVAAGALTGGLLLAVEAVVANIAGMAEGAAEATRKIQELEAGLNMGDLHGISKVTQQLEAFASAKAAAVSGKSLLAGWAGVFTGSNTRDLTAASVAGKEVDNLNQKLHESNTNIRAISKASGIGFKALADSAKAGHLDMSGDINANSRALLEFYEKSIKGRVGAKDLAAAVDDMAQSADDATGATETLDEALNKLANSKIDAASAALEFEQAVSDAKDSVQESGKVYDKNGKVLHKGVKESEAARQALLGIAKAGLQMYAAQDAIGASSTTLNGTLKSTRDEFIRTAMQMGMSKTAASKYADELGILPPAKETTVKINGIGKAKDDVVSLDTLIDRMLAKLKDPAELIIDVITNTKPTGKAPGGTPLIDHGAGTGSDLILGPLGAEPTLPTARTPTVTPIGGHTGGQATAPIVIPQSKTTQYNLNGPVVASDPAKLQRELEKKARLAALRGAS